MAGSTAAGSLEVKVAVPTKPVTVLLAASSAVTVNVNATPAVVVGGAAVTEKWVTPPAATLIGPETPVMLGVTVSVAVIVCTPAI